MTGAILCIARNNAHLTKAAVRTALAQDVTCDVLVIDNASSDGTAAWIRSKEHERIYAACFTQQKSLAACWNFGLSWFWTQCDRPVLVINNDVEILPCTYRLLHESSKALSAPFITGVSVASVDQRDQCNAEEGMLTSRPHPDFSCFMISTTVRDRAGRFDEEYYPAYCEDSDYHVRMHRAHVNAVCVDLPFYHAAAQTVKQAEPGERERIMRGADANRERFRKTYGCLPGSPEYYKLFT